MALAKDDRSHSNLGNRRATRVRRLRSRLCGLSEHDVHERRPHETSLAGTKGCLNASPPGQQSLTNLVRGGRSEVEEGTWSPAYLTIVEFASLADAHGWYASSDYAAIKPLRLDNADSEITFVEGLYVSLSMPGLTVVQPHRPYVPDDRVCHAPCEGDQTAVADGSAEQEAPQRLDDRGKRLVVGKPAQGLRHRAGGDESASQERQEHERHRQVARGPDAVGHEAERDREPCEREGGQGEQPGRSEPLDRIRRGPESDDGLTGSRGGRWRSYPNRSPPMPSGRAHKMIASGMN